MDITGGAFTSAPLQNSDGVRRALQWGWPPGTTFSTSYASGGPRYPRPMRPTSG